MLQTKEQCQNLQDQINEEWNKQPTWKRIQSNDTKDDPKSREQNGENTRNFNKDLEELKSKQTVMNNTITEIKNILKGINNRITEEEERIGELEDKNGGNNYQKAE